MVVHLLRYSGPFLKWTREELKQMEKRTNQLITLYKALYPRNDVGILYSLRKEGGRGLASIENSVDTSIKLIDDYKEKPRGKLITATRNNTDDARIIRTKNPENKNGKKNNTMGILSD